MDFFETVVKIGDIIQSFGGKAVDQYAEKVEAVKSQKEREHEKKVKEMGKNSRRK